MTAVRDLIDRVHAELDTLDESISEDTSDICNELRFSWNAELHDKRMKKYLAANAAKSEVSAKKVRRDVHMPRTPLTFKCRSEMSSRRGGAAPLSYAKQFRFSAQNTTTPPPSKPAEDLSTNAETTSEEFQLPPAKYSPLLRFVPNRAPNFEARSRCHSEKKVRFGDVQIIEPSLESLDIDHTNATHRASGDPGSQELSLSSTDSDLLQKISIISGQNEVYNELSEIYGSPNMPRSNSLEVEPYRSIVNPSNLREYSGVNSASQTPSTASTAWHKSLGRSCGAPPYLSPSASESEDYQRTPQPTGRGVLFSPHTPSQISTAAPTPYDTYTDHKYETKLTDHEIQPLASPSYIDSAGCNVKSVHQWSNEFRTPRQKCMSGLTMKPRNESHASKSHPATMLNADELPASIFSSRYHEDRSPSVPVRRQIFSPLVTDEEGCLNMTKPEDNSAEKAHNERRRISAAPPEPVKPTIVTGMIEQFKTLVGVESTHAETKEVDLSGLPATRRFFTSVSCEPVKYCVTETGNHESFSEVTDESIIDALVCANLMDVLSKSVSILDPIFTGIANFGLSDSVLNVATVDRENVMLSQIEIFGSAMEQPNLEPFSQKSENIFVRPIEPNSPSSTALENRTMKLLNHHNLQRTDGDNLTSETFCSDNKIERSIDEYVEEYGPMHRMEIIKLYSHLSSSIIPRLVLDLKTQYYQGISFGSYILTQSELGSINSAFYTRVIAAKSNLQNNPISYEPVSQGFSEALSSRSWIKCFFRISEFVTTSVINEYLQTVRTNPVKVQNASKLAFTRCSGLATKFIHETSSFLESAETGLSSTLFSTNDMVGNLTYAITMQMLPAAFAYGGYVEPSVRKADKSYKPTRIPDPIVLNKLGFSVTIPSICLKTGSMINNVPLDLIDVKIGRSVCDCGSCNACYVAPDHTRIEIYPENRGRSIQKRLTIHDESMSEV